MKNEYRLAVVIPVYNHENAIGETLAAVLKFGFPVLLVNDGSRESCRQILRNLSEQYVDQVSLLDLSINHGKGGALKEGFKKLFQEGYSHILQIDSDGQHDASDFTTFVHTSRTTPQALVTGYPIFDESVPKLRYYCRYLTHIWVWINTLSFQIRDTMCGYRIYPLNQVIELLEQEPCGNRMDFDPEILVRWFWRGYPVINLPTHVSYPVDGVSNFKAWKDNWLITVMHTRLFFGMLIRLPRLLRFKFNG